MADNQVFSIENVNSQTLSIVNKCREILQNADANLQNELGLPQIAVIGLQSAGKSSLLNGILGHQLFESNEGMCTRNPVNFELHPIDKEVFVNILKDNPNAVFKAELQVSGQLAIVYTIDDLRTLMTNATNFILGYDKNDPSNILATVSPTVLHVRIYKVGLSELSLIDLPGIIDAQDQLTIQIQEIVDTYIRNEKTIIVLAHNSTNDYQTNKLFHVIRKYDEHLERTILVYTRCDMLYGSFNRISSEIDLFKKNKMFSK
jgi:dynamin 1-like protein